DSHTYTSGSHIRSYRSMSRRSIFVALSVIPFSLVLIAAGSAGGNSQTADIGHISWHEGSQSALGVHGNATRMALLVGISDYPGEDEALGGAPINDGTLMRHLLINRLGFDSSNILVLTDQRATRANIIDGFRRHLSKAGQSGSAVFFFSGHGS